MMVDAVVVGAGISGAACAYQLATAGLSVTGQIAAAMVQDQPIDLPLGPFALARFDRWNALAAAMSLHG